MSEYLEGLALGMAEVESRRQFATLSSDLVKVLVAVARGDMESLPQIEPIVPRARLLAIVRRAVTPVILLALALALNLLPVSNLEAAGVASAQVALAVTAILSLIPMDADAKKQVSSLFDPHLRN